MSEMEAVPATDGSLRRRRILLGAHTPRSRRPYKASTRISTQSYMLRSCLQVAVKRFELTISAKQYNSEMKPTVRQRMKATTLVVDRWRSTEDSATTQQLAHLCKCRIIYSALFVSLTFAGQRFVVASEAERAESHRSAAGCERKKLEEQSEESLKREKKLKGSPVLNRALKLSEMNFKESLARATYIHVHVHVDCGFWTLMKLRPLTKKEMSFLLRAIAAASPEIMF